jgi:hypothetical protein
MYLAPQNIVHFVFDEAVMVRPRKQPREPTWGSYWLLNGYRLLVRLFYLRLKFVHQIYASDAVRLFETTSSLFECLFKVNLLELALTDDRID